MKSKAELLVDLEACAMEAATRPRASTAKSSHGSGSASNALDAATDSNPSTKSGLDKDISELAALKKEALRNRARSLGVSVLEDAGGKRKRWRKMAAIREDCQQALASERLIGRAAELRPKSAGERKLAKRERQKSELYKATRMRRLHLPERRAAKQAAERAPAAKLLRLKRLWRPGVRAAKRKAALTEECKAKKRTREKAPKAKDSRVRRKRFDFWRPCFRKWQAFRQCCQEVCRVAVGRGLAEEGELHQQARRWLQVSNAQPCAPLLDGGGDICILQHGERRVLPRLDLSAASASGCAGSGIRVSEQKEYQRALELKCRLSLRCCKQTGCVQQRDRQHRAFFKSSGLNYVCPLEGLDAAGLDGDGAAAGPRWPKWSAPLHYSRLPTPSQDVRPYTSLGN